MDLVRVLVVEDDPFTRALTSSLITSLGYELCASVDSVVAAMDAARAHAPAAALLDMDLGEGPTGVDLAHGLRKILPRISIVMLSSYGAPAWMGQRRQPPVGTAYLVKGLVADTQVVSDALADVLANPLASRQSQSVPAILSDGQWEILRLVAAGYSNAEIAHRRTLTEEAVKKAVNRLLKQLNLDPGPGGNARALLTQSYFRLTGTVSERRG